MFFTRYSDLDWFWRWQWALLAVPMLLVCAGTFEWISVDWFIAVPMNLIFLAHCVIFIMRGCQQANAKLVAFACLLFSVLVFTRYADLFDSLLLRGLTFLMLGAGLFVVGNFYSRLRKDNPGDASMRAIAILLLIVFQIVVLAYMTGNREYILRYGQIVYLRTAPIDPRDLFRGDFVRLNYELTSVDTSLTDFSATKINKGHKVFALLQPIAVISTPLRV